MTRLVATNKRQLAWSWLLAQLDTIATDSGYNTSPTIQTELPSGDVSTETIVPEIGDDEVVSREIHAAQDYEITQPFSIRVFVPPQSGATAELARRAVFSKVNAVVQDIRSALCSSVATGLVASIAEAGFEMGGAEGVGLTKFDDGESRGAEVTVNCAVTYRERMEW